MRKLNLAEWAAVGEIVASVGVIVSLIFVAHSINASTNDARASQTHAIFEAARNIELAVASDAEWSRIIVQGRSRQEPLSAVDQHRYDVYVVATLDLWDQMLERLDYGFMTREEVEGWEVYFSEWARRHLSDIDWERVKWNYTTGHLDSRVDEAISGRSGQ